MARGRLAAGAAIALAVAVAVPASGALTVFRTPAGGVACVAGVIDRHSALSCVRASDGRSMALLGWGGVNSGRGSGGLPTGGRVIPPGGSLTLRYPDSTYRCRVPDRVSVRCVDPRHGTGFVLGPAQARPVTP